MWDDSGVGGGDKGKRESASSSSLDSAMIKPKYHFDRRFCLSLSIRPTQIAVSALPSFRRSDQRPSLLEVERFLRNRGSQFLFLWNRATRIGGSIPEE